MAMALGQIQRRYSRLLSDAFSYCRNSRIQQSISRNSAWQKRFYFKKRAYDEGWFHNPMRVGLAVFLLSSGAQLGVSCGNWVTVPYTGRTHFILFGKFLRYILPDGSILVRQDLLPPHDPDYIVAREIFQDIIDQALPLENEIKRALENQNQQLQGFEITLSLRGPMDDYEAADIVVVESPEVAAKSFRRFGKIYVTNQLLQYYAGYDEMIATIFGRVVGHDLARHAEEKISKFISLASAMGMSVYLCWQSTYIRSIMPHLVVETLMRHRFLPSFSLVVTVALLSYFPMMKYSREIELEADHIGLMLASSAGYNPIVGLMFPVYKAKLMGRRLPECFYSTPSGGTRSVRLGRPKVLTEAMHRNPRAKNPDSS